MDASTAMENNTTEYKNEKLVLGNAAKRKFPFGNGEDLKEQIATNENDKKSKLASQRGKDRHKLVTCAVCFKSMRSDKLKRHMKVHAKKEKLNDNANSILMDLIQVSEKRFQVANVTAQHFFKMNESLQFGYEMLERILLFSLSNGMAIAKGQHNNIVKVRKILKQSFEYLVRVNNIEMFRLAAELESEIMID